MLTLVRCSNPHVITHTTTLTRKSSNELIIQSSNDAQSSNELSVIQSINDSPSTCGASQPRSTLLVISSHSMTDAVAMNVAAVRFDFRTSVEDHCPCIRPFPHPRPLSVLRQPLNVPMACLSNPHVHMSPTYQSLLR